jgi:hypothetical protein
MKSRPNDKPQLDKVKDAARELDADDEDRRFKELLRDLAKPKGQPCHVQQSQEAIKDSMRAIREAPSIRPSAKLKSPKM